MEQYHWKGKHLGLGSNVGYSLFYYNTALFSENGVPAPSDDWTRAWTSTSSRTPSSASPGGTPWRGATASAA